MQTALCANLWGRQGHCHSQGYHFVAAFWLFPGLEGKGRKLPFIACLLSVSPFRKEQCSHPSCGTTIIIFIISPHLQMKNWDSDGWSTLLNTSERQCWHLNLRLFVQSLCSCLYTKHPTSQSQVHALSVRLIQQPEMISHIWANCFTNEWNKHGAWGKKGQWNSNTTAKHKQTKQNPQKFPLSNRKHIWWAQAQHCCREPWGINITNCVFLMHIN